MNGAECLLRTLLGGGIETCFMNPGTSEMQFVAALDRVPGMRGVPCLFEGVCSGAADGYARMLRRPASTLLHLGPGLGNGLANFHNARKAKSPVVSIVGEHTTRHLRYDAPLTADIELFARTVSGWVRTLDAPSNMGRFAAEAIAESQRPPGQVATLIVPADYSWSPGGEPGPKVSRPAGAALDWQAVREAAGILRGGSRAGILLGGGALLERGLEAAGRIAASTSARVFSNRFAARTSAGGARFVTERIPYFPEKAVAMLEGLEHLVLVESPAPVSFFGYASSPSYLAPEGCAPHVLAPVDGDGTEALEALAEELGAGPPPAVQHARPEAPRSGPLTLDAIGRTLAAVLPPGAVLSDEMVSSGETVSQQLRHAAEHELLPVTGGSIGQGIPVALGAAIACPDRKVVALEADGSGMYTLQGLWTMARLGLDVVTVIFANRRYRILDIEMRRTGAGDMGPRANDMIDIARPALDWVKLAEGQGVRAARAGDTDAFVRLFRQAMTERGPALIEAVL